MTHPLVTELLQQPAFALIRVRDSDTVTLIGGPHHDVERLAVERANELFLKQLL